MALQKLFTTTAALSLLLAVLLAAPPLSAASRPPLPDSSLTADEGELDAGNAADAGNLADVTESADVSNAASVGELVDGSKTAVGESVGGSGTAEAEETVGGSSLVDGSDEEEGSGSADGAETEEGGESEEQDSSSVDKHAVDGGDSADEDSGSLLQPPGPGVDVGAAASQADKLHGEASRLMGSLTAGYDAVSGLLDGATQAARQAELAAAEWSEKPPKEFKVSAEAAVKAVKGASQKLREGHGVVVRQVSEPVAKVFKDGK